MHYLSIGNDYLSHPFSKVIIMYDVMLDFPIASPTETTMSGIMNSDDIPYYQQGDYISWWLEEAQIVIMKNTSEPKPNHCETIKDYNTFHKAWVKDNMLDKRYVPLPSQHRKVVRNLNSWDKWPCGSHTTTSKEGLWWNMKVWRCLGNGRFMQMGVNLSAEANMTAYQHYSNRIKSIPIIKRFKDKDLKSMNIYVGETVADLLSNFTLDIPREQFVFPYPHGVSFVRKDFTTYLYQENEKIFWNYFGNDGKFRVNAIDLDDITINERISQKSIHRFFKSQDKELKGDLELFMHNYFEDKFGIKTEETGDKVLSFGLISALMEFIYGFKTKRIEKTINIIDPATEAKWKPNLADCWNIMVEDLLKIICLNDQDFAKEKLKKTPKGKAISSKTNPKRVGRRYFKWGEDDVQYVYPKSGENGTKVRRHMRRGHTRKQPIKYPEKYDGKAFQMGGDWYVSKTIAPYWAGGKSSIPENQISPFCFGAIKMKYAGGSRIASQWIREIEKELGRKLLHNENGGKEYRVPYNNDKYFFLDAYDEDTNTVYEFHGDYYHGNPNIFNAEDLNKTVKKTFGELHEATMQKKAVLEDLGYNYISIWESEFQSEP